MNILYIEDFSSFIFANMSFFAYPQFSSNFKIIKISFNYIEKTKWDKIFAFFGIKEDNFDRLWQSITNHILQKYFIYIYKYEVKIVKLSDKTKQWNKKSEKCQFFT